MSKITNDGLTRSGMHRRMLYSRTRMATVGVKGLKTKTREPAVAHTDRAP